MSASKSASTTRRRLSLLSGGSLAAALLSAGAVAWLSPTIALAANECGDPGTNGTSSDSFTCTGSFASITYPATNGNLSLTLQNNLTTTTGGLVIATAATTQVNIGRSDSPTNTGDPSLTSTSGAGLQITRTAGGSISVSLNDPDLGDTRMVISGTSAGVRLQNVGTGSINFTTGVSFGTPPATSGSTISASAGAGIEMGAGTGSITLTSNSAVSGTTDAVLVTAGLDVTITNQVAGVLNGRMTLNNTGLTTLANDGRWVPTGTSTLGSGVTTFSNTLSGVIANNAGTATLNFGAGADSLTNAGTLAAGGGTEGASTLVLAGLETWTNSGTVLFGANGGYTATDGVTNDRIAATSPLTFIGGGKLVMDVNLGGTAQASCAAAVVADCLDLTGATTVFTAELIIMDTATGLGAANAGMALIDVSGGTSSAENFVLSHDSPGWKTNVGSTDGVLDAGLFIYDLVYDPATRRHMLVSSPDEEALEFALTAAAAQSVWETTTGSWFDRQVDLRDSRREPGAGPGVWVRAAGTFVDRPLHRAYDASGSTYEFNNSYAQQTTALVGGVDFLNVAQGGRILVAGVTAGRVTSDLDFVVSPTTVGMEGHSLGAYASYASDLLFIDAIVSSNTLDLEYAAPSIGVAGLPGQSTSLGYQAEAGVRIAFNDGLAFIEPLLALSHVSTEFDDIALPGAAVDYGDMTSFKGAVGVRLSGLLPLSPVTAKFAVTGRVWEEFEGQNTITLTSNAQDFSNIDDTSGAIGDLGVSLSLVSGDGRLSAFVDYGMRFQDDYQSTDLAVGVRYGW